MMTRMTNDNGSLCHRLGLDFKGKFHAQTNGNKEDERVELEEEGREGARTKGRNPETVQTAEVTAMAPPWILARAQKPAGEEVSFSLLLLLY
jgi:hypothetical protein